ncbi:class I SAM-dependent methyltransferase [Streptomyces sp. NPDC096142]|uniref:class I SAM-dependent methyltransferase n=1 Tax=Streptomyces sp. NPDC096142 TaxID=3366077 RepID=UPI00381B646B
MKNLDRPRFGPDGKGNSFGTWARQRFMRRSIMEAQPRASNSAYPELLTQGCFTMVQLTRSSRQPLGNNYKFGDNNIAARRLSTVADVFDASSRAFLLRSASQPVRLAVDLGCGPGHSTRLIAEVVQAQRVVGLDRSEAFLARAGTQGAPPISYQQHDVTTTPFPVEEQPDLLYARLLLSHLRDAVSVVGRWTRVLGLGGRLLLDEVNSVDTEDPVAMDYQRVVQAMLVQNGQRLDVGRLLSQMPDPAGTVIRKDHLVEVRPTSRQVGRMFALNLRVWSSDPYVIAEFGEKWLARLQDRLDQAASGEADIPVTWTMRQMVLGI